MCVLDGHRTSGLTTACTSAGMQCNADQAQTSAHEEAQGFTVSGMGRQPMRDLQPEAPSTQPVSRGQQLPLPCLRRSLDVQRQGELEPERYGGSVLADGGEGSQLPGLAATRWYPASQSCSSGMLEEEEEEDDDDNDGLALRWQARYGDRWHSGYSGQAELSEESGELEAMRDGLRNSSKGRHQDNAPEGVPGWPPQPASAASATAAAAGAAVVPFDEACLRCPLCLTLMAAAVQMRPCGHSFCATCLSHHLGAQLQAGVQLACPYRCTKPDRIVVDHVTRYFVNQLLRPLCSSSSGSAIQQQLATSTDAAADVLGLVFHGQDANSSSCGMDEAAAARPRPPGHHERVKRQEQHQQQEQQCSGVGSSNASGMRVGGEPASASAASNESYGCLHAAMGPCAPQAADRGGYEPSLFWRAAGRRAARALSAADGHGLPFDPSAQYLDLLTRMAASALVEQEQRARLQQLQPGPAAAAGAAGSVAALSCSNQAGDLEGALQAGSGQQLRQRRACTEDPVGDEASDVASARRFSGDCGVSGGSLSCGSPPPSAAGSTVLHAAIGGEAASPASSGCLGGVGPGLPRRRLCMPGDRGAASPHGGPDLVNSPSTSRQLLAGILRAGEAGQGGGGGCATPTSRAAGRPGSCSGWASTPRTPAFAEEAAGCGGPPLQPPLLQEPSREVLETPAAANLAPPALPPHLNHGCGRPPARRARRRSVDLVLLGSPATLVSAARQFAAAVAASPRLLCRSAAAAASALTAGASSALSRTNSSASCSGGGGLNVVTGSTPGSPITFARRPPSSPLGAAAAAFSGTPRSPLAASPLHGQQAGPSARARSMRPRLLSFLSPSSPAPFPDALEAPIGAAVGNREEAAAAGSGSEAGQPDATSRCLERKPVGGIEPEGAEVEAVVGTKGRGGGAEVGGLPREGAGIDSELSSGSQIEDELQSETKVVGLSTGYHCHLAAALAGADGEEEHEEEGSCSDPPATRVHSPPISPSYLSTRPQAVAAGCETGSVVREGKSDQKCKAGEGKVGREGSQEEWRADEDCLRALTWDCLDPSAEEWQQREQQGLWQMQEHQDFYEGEQQQQQQQQQQEQEQQKERYEVEDHQLRQPEQDVTGLLAGGRQQREQGAPAILLGPSGCSFNANGRTEGGAGASRWGLGADGADIGGSARGRAVQQQGASRPPAEATAISRQSQRQRVPDPHQAPTVGLPQQQRQQGGPPTVSATAAASSVRDRQDGGGGNGRGAAAMSTVGADCRPASHGLDSTEAAMPPLMSLLCPLCDEDLPVEVSAIKAGQAHGALLLLKDQVAAARAAAAAAVGGDGVLLAFGPGPGGSSAAAASRRGRAAGNGDFQALGSGTTSSAVAVAPAAGRAGAGVARSPSPASGCEAAAVTASAAAAAAALCPISCGMSLEALARLSWSDDEVRDMVANAGGIRAIVDTMRCAPELASLQCMGCLSLMGLVRGDGELCQANQWAVAKAGGVDSIAEAMERFPDSLMVQLAALLCLIPLTWDNAMMQAYLSRRVLPAVLAALAAFPADCAVQCKGMELLGVMVEGREPLQEAVRQRLVEGGAMQRIAATLSGVAVASDEALWACLFCLAGLSRQPTAGSPADRKASAVSTSAWEKARAQALEYGVLGGLRECMAGHAARVARRGVSPDEMIVGHGRGLVEVLEAAAARRRAELDRRTRWATVAGIAAAAVASSVLLWLRSGLGPSDGQL